MKMKLTVMIATVVAISSLSLQAQEPTEEQKEAIKTEAIVLQMRQEDSAKKAAEALARLTPEQRKRFDDMKEMIDKTMKPPLPTNSPPNTVRPAIKKEFSAKRPVSAYERMVNRIEIIKSQILEGESTEMIDVINRHIVELDKLGVDPENIRGWITRPPEENFHKGQGDAYSPDDILANIYSVYNTGGGNAWSRPNNVILRTLWGPEPRTLVPTNGPSLRTYQGLLYDDEAVIYTSQGITNHIDYMSDPSDHLIATWHLLYNQQPGDIYEFQLSTNAVHITTNRLNRHFVWTEDVQVISDWGSWARSINRVPAFTNVQQLYLSLYLYKSGPQQPGVEAHFDVNSAQWIPYWYPPINEDTAVEDTGTQIMVHWNTVVYRPQFWQLEFALNVNGPWAAVTNQITEANEVSTVTFPKDFAQNRFYRFHHRY